MPRPRNPDKWEKIPVKCALCGKITERTKWEEERRKRLGKRATCSRKCSGRLGGLMK